MRQLAYALPQLPGLPIRSKTYAAWPVWSGSTTDNIKWPQVIKEAVHDWYRKAEDWNARKEIAQRYGGTLGSSAMRVFECLVFKFQNYDSQGPNAGRLDPSYEGIAAETGLGRSTVAVALRRLKQFGLVHWQQRSCHHWNNGRFELKQITNAYMLLPPTQWLRRVIDLPSEPPPPDPETWGAIPPLPDVMTQALEEERQGGSRKTAIALLEQDDNEPNALALAGLFRRIEESRKPGET